MITEIENLLNENPYHFPAKDKKSVLLEALNQLTQFHKNNCRDYKRIINGIYPDFKQATQIEDIPYIPVRLFKEYDLRSISTEETIRTLTSSGTTSQKVSKIFLDKITALYQTKVLASILKTFLGKQRLPMLILDSKHILSNPEHFSARGAGILGLSNFGRDHLYLLNEDMQIDFPALENFLQRYKNHKIFVFGFTFMIWQYFYQPLLQSTQKIDLSNALLIHSGGWKKLTEQAVDNKTFKKCLNTQTKINDIYNFYGMVEQVGSIFMECEQGYLHAPVFSDILIRSLDSRMVIPHGEKGVVEVISMLPKSYPGHALLTEDLGMIHGEDDCLCGRKGKYFEILGRIPKAEMRGCSDTHAYSSSGA